jgi:membrane protein DedA with SNARE-associated domain
VDSARQWLAGLRRTQVVQVVVWAVLGFVLVITVLEAVGDFFDLSLDADAVAQTFARPEAVGVGLVAIEEAGLPLPISGDLLIMYSASRVERNLTVWLILGLGFEVAVLVGSSFLFAVARRWGTRLLYGAPGRALHLTPERIKQVEGWFRRWGIWAVIFGRYVPGFRVAVTVVAASFQVSYRVFISGVALSAAVWITGFMALGLLVGPKAAQLLGTHQNSSLTILGAIVVIGVLYFVVRMSWRRRRVTGS